MADRLVIVPLGQTKPLGTGRCARRLASLLVTQDWPAQYQQSYGANGHLNR